MPRRFASLDHPKWMRPRCDHDPSASPCKRVRARPRGLRPSERIARICGENVRDTARPGKRTTGLEPATFGLGINGSIRPHNEAGIRHPSSFDTKPVRPHRREHNEGHATAGHSVVTVSPSPRVRLSPSGRRDAARTRGSMLARLGFGSPGLPGPERLTAAAAGCWTGRSSAPARTRTWDLRFRRSTLRVCGIAKLSHSVALGRTGRPNPRGARRPCHARRRLPLRRSSVKGWHSCPLVATRPRLRRLARRVRSRTLLLSALKSQRTLKCV